MKKIFVTIFFLLGSASFAQIVKMNKLSSSGFLNSRVVLDDNNQDVFGYFSLYQKSRINDDILELEYVLLDKDLNQLHTGTFRLSDYGAVVKVTPYLQYTKKIKNNLYFSISFRSKYGTVDTKGRMVSYRRLNLNDYTLTGTHKLLNDQWAPEPDKKITDKDYYASTYFQFTSNGNGIIASGTVKEDLDHNMSQIKFYDLSFKEKWIYKFNGIIDKKSKANSYSYLKSDGNDIVLVKKYLKKATDSDPIDLSLQLVDAETGKNKFEIPLKDAQYIYQYEKLFFQNDKVILLASLYKFNEMREYKLLDNLGYVKVVYDRNTGKELGKDFAKWQDISSEIKFDGKGNVKGYGRIYFLDYRMMTDGKLVVYGEGHQTGSIAHIMDVHMFVFDDKLKLVNYNQVEKASRILNYPPFSGEEIESNEDFDYMYSQMLADDEYVYYYKNKMKPKGEHPKWVLGVMTYKNGAFDQRIISLKTSDGNNIIPIPAKKGYVLLKEVPEKGSGDDEVYRLEKVN